MKSLFSILCVALLMTPILGCTAQRPVLIPERTIRPAISDTLNLFTPKTETPSPEVTNEPAAFTHDAAEWDALGIEIKDARHFERYISYRDLYVYEQDGYTYLDGIIKNEYPVTLVCVLDVCFLDGGEEIAKARVVSGDGSSLLYLVPGDTRIYADVKTDMAVTMTDIYFETVGDTAAPMNSENG